MDKRFIGKDLNGVFYSYAVDVSKLTEEQKEMLGGFDDDEDWVLLSGATIDEYGIDYDAVDWYDYDCELNCDPDFIENFIKKSGAYLVFASGCRWNGASGYTIARDFEEAMYRDYENHQYIEGQSKGRKVLYVSEHSHDVPMGSGTKYIALTDREYERLKDADFKTVQRFASQFKLAERSVK